MAMDLPDIYFPDQHGNVTLPPLKTGGRSRVMEASGAVFYNAKTSTIQDSNDSGAQAQDAEQEKQQHWLQVRLVDRTGITLKNRTYIIYDKQRQKILHQGSTNNEVGLSEKLEISTEHNEVVVVFSKQEKWEEESSRYSSVNRLVVVEIDRFQITDIPAIMRANDWEVGAHLMEKWFSTPAYTYPDSNLNDPLRPYDNQIVTLGWALQYPRAKEVYDAMWDEKIYVNDAAKLEIENTILRNGLAVKNTTQKFGDLTQAINKINQDGQFYIQFRRVGSLFETAINNLDDMHAALARFTFRMAVEGEVAHKGRQDHPLDLFEDELYEIRLKRVGIYLRDSYDFIGSQTGGLGYWSKGDNKARKSHSEGYHYVENADFRVWRKQHNKGGDFTVYSDMEIREVNESWIIEANQ